MCLNIVILYKGFEKSHQNMKYLKINYKIRKKKKRERPRANIDKIEKSEQEEGAYSDKQGIIVLKLCHALDSELPGKQSKKKSYSVISQRKS